MILLHEIPLQIYYRIREFCSFQDYMYFMNVNKKNFKEIKKETIYFPLSKDHSLIVASTTFYHRVFQVVKFPGQQIGLTLDANDDLKMLESQKVRKLFLSKRTKNRFNYIYNLTLLSGIPFLKLSGENLSFQGSTDKLRNVLKLVLSGIPETSVQKFDLFFSSGLKVLEIKNCQIPANILELLALNCSATLMKIVFINQDNDFSIPNDILSHFDCLTIIELDNCLSIRDVCPFATVENLLIRDCTNIDWKMYFPKNRKLEIRNSSCDRSQNIPALDISNLESIWLENVLIPENFFTLFQYQFDSLRIKSLSFVDVKTIPSLELPNNHSVITRINLKSKIHIPSFILQQLKHLSLKNHFLNSTVEAFQNIYRVELIDVEGLLNVDGLGNIPFLHIRRCSYLIDISQLGGPKQRKVIFGSNRNVKSFRGLNSVPIVVLDDIHMIDWLEIKNVKDLTVSYSTCYMNFAGYSASLIWERITIIDCSSLFQLYGLEEVPFISIQCCSLRSLLTFPEIGKNQSLRISLKGCQSYELQQIKSTIKQFEFQHAHYYHKEVSSNNCIVFHRINR